MNYEIVTLQEKLVSGIAARTNNDSPDMGRVIGGLWNRFYQGGIYESIPNKTDNKAIGLYTDYAGGATDDYTAMVCCTVTKESKISECEFRKIPAGPYAKFVIADGTFVAENGMFVLDAVHFTEAKGGIFQGETAEFKELKQFGRCV